MSSAVESPLQLTEAAANEIRRRAGAQSVQGLRVFVNHGGCSGMQYEMQIAARQPGDIELNQFDVLLFVEERSVIFLQGSTIDYQDGLTAAGFRIQNPNAKATCGCGTSFEA